MRVWLLVLVFAFAVVGPPSRQGTAAGATVSGEVRQDTDSSGTFTAPDRPAVTVVDLERRIGGEVAWFVSLYTDRDGRFAFTDVPPGDYAVIAYWPQAFVSPPGLPNRTVPAAEWGFKVESAGLDSLRFLVTDLAASSPAPAEDRPRPIPSVGSLSVAGQRVPDIPSTPGAPLRILAPPDAIRVTLVRLFGPAESHIARRNQAVCGSAAVTAGIAEITPVFTYTCPPGIRIAILVDYAQPGRPGSVAAAQPPIEWRPAASGEATHTVRADIAPPSVGEAGLKPSR